LDGGWSFRGVPVCKKCFFLARTIADKARKRADATLEVYYDYIAVSLTKGTLSLGKPPVMEFGDVN